MSDLQIGLLVIGAAIVAAVLLFNWVQERRFRKQADAAFQAPAGDALMQPATSPYAIHKRVEPALHEPVIDIGELDEAVEIETRDFQRDSAYGMAEDFTAPFKETAPDFDTAASRPLAPSVSAIPASITPPTPISPVVPPPAPYDDLIEYRVCIESDGMRADVFADAFNHVRTLGKPVRWMGLQDGASEWTEIQPWRDLHYQQMMVAIQLADRNGAAQEEQLSAFCTILQGMAQAHGLPIVCGDLSDAVERAETVDRFCVDVDVLIGLNVVARGEGSVNLMRILHEAESSGMVLGKDGVFQLLDSRGEALYALCNYDAEPFSTRAAEGKTSQGVTLQFDVPRVPDGIKVFDSMVAFGRKLASEVGGILVDDNLRPLTDTGIEKIRGQLTQIYERMEARGVPSGSWRALRLFS